jgi:hypothetical protein
MPVERSFVLRASLFLWLLYQIHVVWSLYLLRNEEMAAPATLSVVMILISFWRSPMMPFADYWRS